MKSARRARTREVAMKDIPPKEGTGRKPAPPGILAQIRVAREAQGPTRYALAKRAGIADQGIIRDVEQGKDVSLYSLQAVAAALGLELELVEVATSET